jgi:hypothetical protein
MSGTLWNYQLEDAIRHRLGNNPLVDGLLKWIEAFQGWTGAISKSTDPSWSVFRSVVRIREELAAALSTVLADHPGSSLSSSILRDCSLADRRTRDCIQRSGLSEYWDQRIETELPIAIGSVFYRLGLCAEASDTATNRPKMFKALKIVFRKRLKHARFKKELEQAHDRLETLLDSLNPKNLPPGFQSEGMKGNITCWSRSSYPMNGFRKVRPACA